MREFDLVVTDMDGTLLNENSELSSESIETFKQIQEKGVIVVFASGRNYLTLNKFAKQIEMDKFGGYFIGANGQQLTHVKQGVTEYKAFINEEKQICFDYAKENNLEFIGVTDDSLFVYISDSLRARKLDYIKENGLDPTVLTAGTFGLIKKQNYEYIYYIDDKSELPQNLNKIVLAEEPEILDLHVGLLRDKIEGVLESELVSPRWLELSPLGVSKGATLKSLASDLEIPLDKILVFGDGENDLSMLRLVKNSYAVENAMETVKEESNFRALSNTDSGVAKAIKEIFNI